MQPRDAAQRNLRLAIESATRQDGLLPSHGERPVNSIYRRQLTGRIGGAAVVLAALTLPLTALGQQEILDDPSRPEAERERDPGSRPVEAFTWFGVEPGLVVGDLIPASGYNSHVLARMVGPDGRVISALTTEEGATGLRGRFHDAGIDNVEVHERLGDVADGSVDIHIIVRNIHDMFIPETAERYGMHPDPILSEVLRTLKPGGVLGVVDARCPEGVDETNHRISEASVIKELEARGFELVERSDLLANPDDDVTAPNWNARYNIDRLTMKFRKPAG